ncbi:YdeI/OmpD-associated family protein [Wenxinia marina]|uniref:Wenxma_20, whole genome shotgun sequence n=1 Tax=Wenxinia marina DSM 24838 TaxID=1123501 RepID=A0A0D0PZA2_9RHOB|nr:YdeI/OmpD-associated family protein [Wenxinia marina]KIQ67684.1 hypothetical protein Wenmar_03813 [Wenxinia marina DSM 24838]GGL79784.1 hypothetical protein GCM10011392_37810 [Wenxinia marina]
MARADDWFEDRDTWGPEARALRRVLLGAGLREEIKWGKPTYGTADGNIAIIQPFKHFLALMFFKGALLDDPEGVLESQGENTRSALRVVFRSVADVERLAGAVRALVASAAEVERKGLKVEGPPELDLCDELVDALDADPALQDGWNSLTPGRQREYALHIGGAKKSETRAARVDKFRDRIAAGRGMRDQ